MKRFLIAAAVVATSVSLAAPALASDVGVSISIGQPGFYGRIDIGGYPQPHVIYRQPIVIERVPMHRPPIYLHVPHDHAKHWSNYCHTYNACGERVFFVKDSWYSREYVPRYQERHRDHRDNRRDDSRDDRHGSNKSDRPGNDRDHGRGH